MGKLVLDTICLEQSRGIITYTPGIDDPSFLLYFDLFFFAHTSTTSLFLVLS